MDMIKNKTGICIDCNDEKEKTIIAGRCPNHYWQHRANISKAKAGSKGETTNNKPIKQRSVKGQKVASEDRKFFLDIWNERPHYSEISNEFLGLDYNPVFMSHILTKASHPRFRHLKENIILMTAKEHNLWEFGDRTTPMFKQKFKRALETQDVLKKQYYEKTT